jgi:hypothetical protein
MFWHPYSTFGKGGAKNTPIDYFGPTFSKGWFAPYTKATLASTLIPILGLEQRKKKHLNPPLKKVEPNKPYSLTLLAPPFLKVDLTCSEKRGLPPLSLFRLQDKLRSN